MSEFSGPAMSVNAVVQTANGSKYLQQLCKHFAHKVPATWTETEGQAALPAGTVRFTAAADSLHMQCEAEDAERLRTTCAVVEDHLLRFAFREDLSSLNWQGDAA